MVLLVVLTAADRQNGHATGFCKADVDFAGNALIAAFPVPLALPATLYRPVFWLGSPPHAACDHFHLRHRCGAVLAFEAWGAASEQLLGAERGDGDKLVRIQMGRSVHHGRPPSKKRDACGQTRGVQP